MIKSFLLGVIAGGAATWIWGDRIRGTIDDATIGVRTRTAEQVHKVADTLQSVADTVDQGLTGAPQQRAS